MTHAPGLSVCLIKYNNELLNAQARKRLLQARNQRPGVTLAPDILAGG